MKKGTLIAFLICAGMVVAYAQDSTMNRPGNQNQPGMNQQPGQRQGQDQAQQGNERNPTASEMQDLTEVQVSAIPNQVKESLKDTKYQGWERGTVYKTEDGDRYVVRIQDPATNRSKWYWFDDEGKPFSGRGAGSM